MVDGPVALSAEPAERVSVDPDPARSGDFNGPVGRPGVDDMDVVELGNGIKAGREVGFLVVGQDDDGDRNGAYFNIPKLGRRATAIIDLASTGTRPTRIIRPTSSPAPSSRVVRVRGDQNLICP